MSDEIDVTLSESAKRKIQGALADETSVELCPDEIEIRNLVAVEGTPQQWETILQFVQNELGLHEEVHDEGTVELLDSLCNSIWTALNDQGGDGA